MRSALLGKRILVTQATEFMGPAICEVFAEQGAAVVADTLDLAVGDNASAAVKSAGDIDVLVANLSALAPSTPATEVGDSEWRNIFAALVDPLPRLVAATVPIFEKRGGGKILLIGSASALHFPPEVQANPRFQERLAREVPLGRLVAAREDALFAAYLCSDAADCFVGQAFPVCGGWATK